ncbi:MAG: DUF6076 domain-containing protein [Clostridiales bacterium]|nr:DUF6076 domain-containing protein [Clostridiales bacterium]
MKYAVFTEDGYDYIDSSYKVFSGGKEHTYLFDYASKDISALPDLLDAFVNKNLGKKTFDLKGYKYAKEDGAQIEEILLGLHPYYVENVQEVIKRALGEMFISRLEIAGKTRENKTWFINRFTGIASLYLNCGDEYPLQLHEEYRHKFRADHPNDWEVLYFRSCSRAFNSELYEHELINRLLYWVLDTSAPYLSNLTIAQRMWLFGNIYPGYSYDFNIEANFTPAQYYHLDREYCDDKDEETNPMYEHANKMHDIFIPIHPYLELYESGGDLTPEAEAALNKAILHAQSVRDKPIYEKHEIKKIGHLLIPEVLQMIRNETKIKKCTRCNRYFVYSNKNSKFCERVWEDGNRCKDVGSSESFQDKLKSDPVLRCYRNVARRFRRWSNSGKIDPAQYENWYAIANKELELVRSGKLSFKEFKDWLDKYKFE